MRARAEHPPLTRKQKLLAGLIVGGGTLAILLVTPLYLLAVVGTGLTSWPAKYDLEDLIEGATPQILDLDSHKYLDWAKLQPCPADDSKIVLAEGRLQCAPFLVRGPTCSAWSLRQCLEVDVLAETVGATNFRQELNDVLSDPCSAFGGTLRRLQRLTRCDAPALGGWRNLWSWRPTVVVTVHSRYGAESRTFKFR